MTGRHRDPSPSSRDRWTINGLAIAAGLLLATAAALLTAASIVGIVTAPSTPNVNTSTGQDAADVVRNALSAPWSAEHRVSRVLTPERHTTTGGEALSQL